MLEHKIKVERTARFYTLGNISENTKIVWFALHGYGQLAQFFMKKCAGLVDETTYVVAPEGLSRFYLDENYQRVGASWMTREAREEEIDEYVAFLQQIYSDVVYKIGHPDFELRILAFSQGCATALRWIDRSEIECKKLLLWAGFFEKGIREVIQPEKLDATDTYYVYGEQDEFLVAYPEISAAFKADMEQQIKVTFVPFTGTHRVDENVLKTLNDSWK